MIYIYLTVEMRTFSKDIDLINDILTDIIKVMLEGHSSEQLKTNILKLDRIHTSDTFKEKKQLQGHVLDGKMFGLRIKALLIMMRCMVFVIRHLIPYTHKSLKKIKDDIKKAAPVISNDKNLGINPDVIQHIISKIEDFEMKKGFLKKRITSIKLAGYFKTNYKYLSKVIRHQKQKTFVNYINDLRIDYIVERLTKEPLLRRYTNSALAHEAGFCTAQNFIGAFRKRMKVSPGYFVDELNTMN